MPSTNGQVLTQNIKKLSKKKVLTCNLMIIKVCLIDNGGNMPSFFDKLFEEQVEK